MTITAAGHIMIHNAKSAPALNPVSSFTALLYLQKYQKPIITVRNAAIITDVIVNVDTLSPRSVMKTPKAPLITPSNSHNHWFGADFVFARSSLVVVDIVNIKCDEG